MPLEVARARPEVVGLQEVGRYFHDRGWSVGTSSNYSVVLDRSPLRLLITASGKDKGRLGPDDFVEVDGAGRAVQPPGAKPSAETHLHTLLANELPEVGAVLHTHSVWGTLLSERYFSRGELTIAGYEMLKGLAGVTTHEHLERVPIFANDQDIPRLAGLVHPHLKEARPALHGFLIRRHGLYTWGRDLFEARRHIEILEFLFEVHARELLLRQA